MTPAIDLLILDNAFPRNASPFRTVEIEFYLQEIPSSRALCAELGWPALGDERSVDAALADYRARHPETAERILSFSFDSTAQAKLAYTVFLGQAAVFLPFLEERRIPFAFTLYPGGLFLRRDPQSDAMLARVLGSPFFRKVVATTPPARAYLLERKLCRPEAIEEIPGLPVPETFLNRPVTDKPRFGKGKSTFDLGFIAHRYRPRGEDKGYDIFLSAARELAERYAEARFHVVGGWSREESDLTGIGDRTTFYGILDPKTLSELCWKIDAVLSPNVDGVLCAGAFDGFPTGSVVSAALSGAAPFCADTLQQNRGFVDGKDIVLIEANALSCVRSVQNYIENPDALALLGERAWTSFNLRYGKTAQMEPRLRMIRSLLAQH